ncbi:MAG: LamG domain-containing protein [Bacteriovoracaceae bacterium]
MRFSSIHFLSLSSLIILLGCNPLAPNANKSTVDTNHRPGQIAVTPTTPLTSHWTFDAAEASNYTPSTGSWLSSTLELSGGVCRLIASDQVDNDDAASGSFSNGVLYGVATYGALSGEPASSGLKLGNNGGCNGSTGACAQQNAPEIYELNSTWTPQWSSIISYYKMNNNWNDSKGSNHATASGATFNASARLGSHAGSFVGGSSDYAALPNITYGANISVAAWVKLNSMTGNTNIISGCVDLTTPGCSGADYQYLTLFIRASGQIKFAAIPAPGVGARGTTGQTVATGLVTTGVWYHVVGVINSAANTTEIYVNGIKYAVNSANTGTGAFSNFSMIVDLGSGYTSGTSGTSNGAAMDGLIDEVAIWNAALTQNEIETIYQRQATAYTGLYTSRVMDAFNSQSWTSLAWAPTLPFFKALPDYASGAIQNETSTSYSSLVGSTGSTGANNLMTGIVGLWHLDESSWNGTTNEVVDKSGQGNHGTATNGANVIINGKFINAGSFDGSDDYISLPSIDFPASGATFSVWFNSNIALGGDRMIAGKNADNDTYIGFLNATTIEVQTDTGGTVKNFTVPTMTSNTWYHLVVTRSSNNTRVFLNGTESSSGAQSQSDVLTINQFARYANLASYYFSGKLDEIAIWSRALHANEIKQLYQRGASRLKFQVRSCDDNACSGETWKGPDGTSASYFSELFNMSTQAATPSGTVNASAPSMTLQNYSSPVSANRYFQYRTIFESDSATAALQPELKSVTVAPTHYDLSSPSVIGNNGISYVSLSSFVQTLGSACDSGIGYNLASSNTGPWKYWNGTSWVTADGTDTQSNPASTVALKIANFGTQFGTGSVFFKAYFKSTGIVPCELDNLQIIGEQ